MTFLNVTKHGQNQGEKLNGKVEPIEFIIDTEASHHMTWNVNFLSNVVDIVPCSIGLPDGDCALAIKQGDLCLGDNMWLTGVLYAPTLKCNLISVAKLLKAIKGSSITFTADLCVLQDHTKMTLIGAGEECGGVYIFRGTLGGSTNKAAVKSSYDLWHRRLGHPSSQVLPYLKNSVGVIGTAENDAVCDICLRAKQTRDCFHDSDNKAAGIFDLIHCDVWGPYRTPSSSGASYFLTVVDDYSRAVWIFLILEKREVMQTLQNFFVKVERQFAKRVKIMRSDNGTEFTCMKAYLNKEGILHQTSCVGTPQQNGRVERKHRHILNVARSLMFQGHIPLRFWGECVLTACHLINRTPTPLLQGKTPYELLFGKAPIMDDLRVFGCLCYAHKQLRDKDKFAERSRRCVFMGYPYGKKGWKLYDMDTGDFFVSRDVVFKESEFPFLLEVSKEDEDLSLTQTVVFEEDDSRNVNLPMDTMLVSLGESSSIVERGSSSTVLEEPPAVIQDHVAPTPSIVPVETRHSQCEKTQSTRLRDYHLYNAKCNDPPQLSPPSDASSSGMVEYPIANYVTCDRFSDAHQVFLAAVTVHGEPKSFAEAVRDEKWRNAMGCEIDALEINETWDLTELPPGKVAIGCQWIFTVKFNSDGTVERYKARLVALGNRQKEGLDYDETFAPVVKMTTVRVFLKVAAAKNWEVHQMDVHNAFLHGELEEEVYMKLPPGFRNSDGNKVCRLKKSIYGLKQAPRCWFAKLTAALTGYGFVQTKTDYSLFRLVRGALQLYVIVYVDDLLIGGNDTEAICRFKGYLGQCFRMKDLGPLKYFLGIEVARSPEGIYLSQRKYACDILAECGLLGSRPVATPVVQHHHLTTEGDDFHEDPEGYRRLVGRLVYLTITRPELSYIVHVLAQFMHQPLKKHWYGALRVVRYLKGSPGQGILLSANNDLRILAYCDADWQACALTRRSLSGYVVMLGDSPVAWKTKKQRVVSRSSAEAEYRSMADTLSELKWDRELLSCFGIPPDDPMTMFYDNQSALYIAANPVFHERTKNIEADCHYIRDEIQAGSLRTSKIHTSEQLADIFTKGLGIQQFEYLRRKLGICDLHAPT